MRLAGILARGAFAAVAALGMAGAARSQETVPANGNTQAPDADRLAALERELAELRRLVTGRTGGAQGEEAPKNRRSVGGVEKPLLGAQIGGYFSLEYFDPEGADPFFDQHRLVLQLAARVSDFVEFDSEIEFEGGGADASFLTGQEILVEYAELRIDLTGGSESLLGDFAVLKAGLILVPFGKFNVIHDDPLNDLTDRPLLTNILPIPFDQPGVGLAGDLPLGPIAFNYDVALIQGLDDGISNSGARGGRQSFRADNNKAKDVVGRAGLALLPGFAAIDLGVSGWHGKYDPQDDREVRGFAFDVTIRTPPIAEAAGLGPVELLYEYQALALHRKDIDPAPAAEPRGMDAYYLQLNLHFFPSFLRVGPFGRESTFTFVVRYEENDFNDRAIGASTTDDRHGYTLGMNLRITEKTVIKLSWQRLFVSGRTDVRESLEKWAASFATYF